MNGALAGVRVLDFSEYIAGPYAGQMLADMGAQVTKVEPPHGDFWRHTGAIAPGESRGFIGVNKGKRSISIDLKTDAGRAIAHRLINSSDVVLTNYRAGVAERLGVDYDTAARLNPRIIYCENTAFGRAGPYAEKAGYDLVSQAMTGIMAFEGGDGPPRSIITTSVTDLAAGMFMAYSIASALYQREITGRGQRIETSLFAAGIAIQYRPMFSIEQLDHDARETLLASLHNAREAGQPADEVLAAYRAQRAAAAGGGNPYYRMYEALDGYFVVACLNNRLRRQLADILGVTDPRLEGNEFDPRRLNMDEAPALVQRMEDAIRTRTVAQWCDLFDARGVPCGPVHLTAELFDDPHVAANDLLVTLDHPVVGPVRMANSPVRMSDADTGARNPSPVLGQHTRDVLAEAGYTEEEVARLERDGVVHSWQPDGATHSSAAAAVRP
jgi:formyl-CoA transferase